MAIGITVGNLDNRSQCFTMGCCSDLFAWGMKHNVYYLWGIHFALGKSVPKHHCRFFFMLQLTVEKCERAWFKLIPLLQGSPIFTLWAEAKPFTRTLWAWLCLSATAVCLCTLSKGQTKFGRQHSAQQTARSIPPLTAKALPCGTRKIPTRCERRKYKKLVHPMGSKPGNPTAKCSHEVCYLVSKLCQTSLTALFGVGWSFWLPALSHCGQRAVLMLT